MEYWCIRETGIQPEVYIPSGKTLPLSSSILILK